jgi:uncharacterized protein YjlB
MELVNKNHVLELYHVNDDGTFPNSRLPVVVYKQALSLPSLFPSNAMRKLFKKNNWKNSWKNGVYEYHHYHSITHEVLGVFKGKTTLLLGGEHGVKIEVEKGDVIIIPAGVAHKNLGKENNICCLGAYPEGKDYDMNYGREGERPQTDKNIQQVPLPSLDPVYGDKGGIMLYWNK